MHPGSSKPFERFGELGVDLTANHDFVGAQAYHMSNKPLFGFANRYQDQDPKYQAEFNIALVRHTGRANVKGVQLCLLAEAGAHTEAPTLRYCRIRKPASDREVVLLSLLRQAMHRQF